MSTGKVRYLGLSDVPAWVAAQAQAIAGFRGGAPVTALQLEYSLLERTGEGELPPVAQALGIGGMPWSPLRSGRLTGKYTRDGGSGGSGRAALDEVSAPALGFPATITSMSANVAFGGMTVDGTSYPAFMVNGKQRQGEY